jgi:hypothetical protein
MSSNNGSRIFGFVFFMLATLYGFADYFIVFPKNDHIGEWKTPIIRAFEFIFQFLLLLVKIFMALLFLFILTCAVLFTVIGIFTKTDTTSNDAIGGALSARKLIDDAKGKYTGTLGMVLDKSFTFIFGILDISQTTTLLLIIPIFMFLVILIYYMSVSKQNNIEKEEQQNVLTTNYHTLNIILFTVILLFCLHLFYLVLPKPWEQ